MNSVLYKQFEQDALQWAEEAGKILIDQEHSFTVQKNKDDVDVCTSADVEVENLLTNKIMKKYPNHGILREEQVPINEESEFQWIIDPLDGTKEYVRGMGEYNVLLAVEENRNVVAGVIRRFGHPVIYSCSKGNGSYMNNTKIHVTDVSLLEKAFVASNLPAKNNTSVETIRSDMQLFAKLIQQLYRLRPGSDDAKMATLVSQGVYDAYLSFPKRQKWWDIAPALLLVEEAGGKVTNWEGNPIMNHDLSKGIVDSN